MKQERFVTDEEIEIAKQSIMLFGKGEYRKAFKLQKKVFGELSNIENFKQSRIERHHQHFVGGGSNSSGHFHWPHCSCGWRGEKVATYDEAKKIPCPNKVKAEQVAKGA